MHFEIVCWYFYHSGTILSYDRISTLKGYISSYWSQIPELIKQEFELPFEIDYF